MTARTILIVGGYGVFGGRLAQLLWDDARLKLIIAGRSIEKARAFCYVRHPPPAQLMPAVFDRNGDLDAELERLAPDIVVDCSGPFQAYGERPYRLIEACIARGVDYLDLADGAAFVKGVSALDDAARARGVFALSGVSSCPVLTAAAARALAADMAHVDVIHAGIAPSPFTRIGENVVRALASYAGEGIAIRRNGETQTAYALIDHQRVTVAPPGRLPLENRYFSLVDVPDLTLLQDLWPAAREIWIGAAPTPEILHRTFGFLAWLREIRAVPALSPLAPLMQWTRNRLRWGAHRGGMFVSVTGRDASGAECKRSWHLIAEGDDGPFIPSMPVAQIIRKLLHGERPAPGARPALNELDLADYDEQFAGRAIVTGVRDDAPPAASLYQRLLGNALKELPAVIGALHVASEARGVGSVTRGANPIAGLVAELVGFPRTGADLPVSVRFDVQHGVETWTRSFAGHTFFSTQSEGEGHDARLLVERFGPLKFAIALVIQDDKLQLVLRRWSAFGVPLPLWLAPRVASHETVGDGRFRFFVDLRHPLIGRIVTYSGWLEPVSPAQQLRQGDT